MDVVWTVNALRDLDQIQDDIAQNSPNAAFKLIDALISRTERLLTEHPLAGRIGRAQGTRELVIRDAPYIVVYRVNNRVEIVAVVHGARRWPESFA